MTLAAPGSTWHSVPGRTLDGPRHSGSGVIPTRACWLLLLKKEGGGVDKKKEHAEPLEKEGTMQFPLARLPVFSSV